MTHENPWTTTSSTVIYRNPWLTLTEHQVVRPDGEPGIYGVVDTRLATGVVAVTEDDEVVLVGQWRYPLGHYSWELPEGGTDGDEDGLSAIRRELREETGFEAEHWEPLGPPVALSNCISSEMAELFLARGLTDVGASPDGDEVLTRRIVPIEEALRMVDEGEITDAMSVIALLRFDRARRSA